MEQPKLTGKEAALIEAARRELAARAATGRAPESSPAPVVRPPVESRAPSSATTGDRAPATVMPRPAIAPPAADAAARIAALMQAEQEQTLRRKKRLRQYGVVIPAAILIAATLWVVVAIFRYARI